MTKKNTVTTPSLNAVVSEVYKQIKPMPDWVSRAKFIDGILLSSYRNDILAGFFDEAVPGCEIFIGTLLRKFGGSKVHSLPHAVLHLLSNDEQFMSRGLDWINRNTDKTIQPGTAEAWGQIMAMVDIEEYPGLWLLGGLVQNKLEASEADPIDTIMSVKRALERDGTPSEEVADLIRVLAAANTQFAEEMANDPELRRIYEDIKANG